jgi:hypothetical protein
MAYQSRVHQPGDLIPSDEWNAISAAVAALDSRVAILESRPQGGLAPIVSGRDPAGDVAVGSRLTVLGRNFLVPADQNTVTLGNAAIEDFLSGSDDEHLVFQIPNAFSGLPQTLQLMVVNRNGTSVPLNVRVLSQQTPQGGMVVFRPQTPAGQTPEVGEQIEFEWDVDSQTTVPERYLLRPLFTNAVGADDDAWQAAATVEPSGVTRITRGNPVRTTISVVVPAGAESVDVALEAVAQDHADLTRTSDAMPVEIGTVLDPSNSATTMTLRPLTPLDEAGQLNPARAATIGTLSGIEVQFGRRAYLQVNAHFQVAGRYRFSVEVENGSGRWTTDLSPQTGTRNANSTSQLDVGVSNTETAPGGGRRFLTVRAVKRNDANNADEFVSYVRFPVRGYTP